MGRRADLSYKPLAKAVKDKVGNKLAVGTVGAVNDGQLANKLLEEGLDIVVCGRGFQKNPGLVWTFAEELGIQIQMANQIRYVCLILLRFSMLTTYIDGALPAVQERRRTNLVAVLRYHPLWLHIHSVSKGDPQYLLVLYAF